MDAGTKNSELAHHLGVEEVERFCMGRISEVESAPFEEHLLLCAACRDAVTDHDLFIQAVRRAAPAARAAPEPRRLWILQPAWMAAAASLLLTGGLLFRAGTHPLEPQSIRLEAMRGIGAKAVADRPLLLHPDLKGLAAYPKYQLEIVNELGGHVFTTEFMAAQPQTTVPGVPPGVYFVRIHSPAGELLREYAVDAR